MFTAIMLYIENGNVLWLLVHICIYVHTYYTMLVYGVIMHMSYNIIFAELSICHMYKHELLHICYVDVQLQLQLFKHCLKFTSEPKDALQLERTKL